MNDPQNIKLKIKRLKLKTAYSKKKVQKLVQKMTPKKVNFKQILGPKMGNFGEAAAQAEPAGALLKALVFKMAPRWLKMASSSPR